MKGASSDKSNADATIIIVEKVQAVGSTFLLILLLHRVT